MVELTVPLRITYERHQTPKHKPQLRTVGFTMITSITKIDYELKYKRT